MVATISGGGVLKEKSSPSPPPLPLPLPLLMPLLAPSLTMSKSESVEAPAAVGRERVRMETSWRAERM